MWQELRPSGPVAALGILPGDPKRAMEIASALLEEPRMVNLARGLWGYTGRAPGGAELTVQSTGIGGPSLATVLHELAGHGMRRAVRVGTCRALDPGLEAGAALVAGRALAGDGAARALGSAAEAEGSAALTQALARELRTRPATVASGDLHHDPDAEARAQPWRERGALAADLATATAFAAGARLGIEVASVLVVVRSAGGAQLATDEADARCAAVARAALAALQASSATPRLP